jgi:hypothetical protein
MYMKEKVFEIYGFKDGIIKYWICSLVVFMIGMYINEKVFEIYGFKDGIIKYWICSLVVFMSPA